MNKEQKNCLYYDRGFCTHGYFDGTPTEANCVECVEINGAMPDDYIKLGDAVEKVAKPIAKVIDKVVGTELQNCGGCKARQEKLNRAIKKM
jgi:hypothetical protein